MVGCGLSGLCMYLLAALHGIEASLLASESAGLPVAHKTWVTLVCLLLDTPFGRRLVGV